MASDAPLAIRWLAGDPARRGELEPALARVARDDDDVHWLRRRPRGRRLARVETASGPCFVKHFRPAPGDGLGEWLKRRLGLSSAAREWRMLVKLHARGIAVPEPLARVALGGGDQMIATRWVDGASLGDAVAAAHGAPRRALLARAGEGVRALHAAGLTHRDLHHENVHVGPDGPLLIDLQAAAPFAPRALRERDLGELDHSLRRVLSTADRVRLRAAALGVARPFDGAARRRLRRIGLAARRRTQAHARSRAARSLRVGRRMQAFEFNGARGLVSRDADPNRVRSALAPEAPDPDFELRRYLEPRAARRAWHTAHALEACGIGAALPVAYVEWPGDEGSLLVVGAGPPAPAADDAERERAVARLGARLREAGFDAARLTTDGLRFERRDGRLEALVWAVEQVGFPARIA